MRIHPTNIEVTPKIAVELRITPIIGDLESNFFALQYSLIDAEGQILKNDRFELTPEEVAGWNGSKPYLENIVLHKLDLHREY